MPRGTEPVLSRRTSSSDRGEQGLAEEDALLTGAHAPAQARSRRAAWKERALFAWALAATVIVIVLAVIYQKQAEQARHAGDAGRPAGKRNLVFMVSDGMGPTSVALTRSFRQHQLGLAWDDGLALDRRQIGQSRTRSSSSLVTDSAAGATAFSCGQKSYNGAISVLPDGSPCGTVLEAAKLAGYRTGLVVTTRITDATPAVFASHVRMRSQEDRIAEQLLGDHPLGRTVDLMLGGGRCHFLPRNASGSCRADDRDMIATAQEAGFTYVADRTAYDALKGGSQVDLPLLGLFADYDIPYEVDRRSQEDVYPSLDEMANTALTALSAATTDSDQGFFLMIEGSRIDHAGHGNDPVAQVHEVLAYDKAFASVLEFLEKDSTDGLLVATSDHETGGLATARQLHSTYPEYLWYPGVLANASHSAENMSRAYHQFLLSSPDADTSAYLRTLIADNLGIHDAHDEELTGLVESAPTAAYTFADMISRRAQTGWTTHGHSGADVNVYASSAEAAAPLIGNHENTDVGKFLRDYLELDVDKVTEKLRRAEGGEFGARGWMGAVPMHDQRLDGQDHMDHYRGDSKKHKRCEICSA